MNESFGHDEICVLFDEEIASELPQEIPLLALAGGGGGGGGGGGS